MIRQILAWYGEYEVEELSEIMKNRGFQGVILAYPVGDGKYMIEAGHRRRYAAKKAGFINVSGSCNANT